MSNSFSDKSQCADIKLEPFWRRCIYLALIAKRIALKNKLPNPDQLFVAAIMSRLGQLICCSTMSTEVAQILEMHIKSPDKVEFSIEKKVLGFTYNQLSANILAHWKLPQDIIHSLQDLHEPLKVSDSVIQIESSVLNVATIFSGLLELDDLNSAV
jgi:HD-like signal output (HDOD) protein